ncbi:MAG TPA: hypothetical protein P5556_07830 [Candidatus Gastranaerophilales bacterium]|nr:hypothetical protein [Candidatus Gastranaerophilales bacterium]
MTVNLKKEFESNIPDNIKEALKFCSKTADDQNLQIFLIGGVVRDIIINKKNFDVDITVQGNAVEFAKSLENSYPELCKIKEIHDNFKTAKILFTINSDIIPIDLASTRKEFYPYPSSLPVIEKIGCELYDDVIRRDFTINSMALALNSSSFCTLIDYLNGYEDLKNGVLEVLHPLSFIDDPTRIVRGLKFNARFGYKFGEKTEALMRECLNSGRFDNLCGERIKLELKHAFNINKADCLSRFIKEDIYKLVDTSLSCVKNIDDISMECENTINEYCNFLDTQDNIWLIYLGSLLVKANQDKISELSKKLYLSGHEETILQDAAKLYRNKEAVNKAKTRFEVYEFFEKAKIESILIFLILNKDLKSKLDLYLKELKDANININGDILISMGLKPSPVFAKILRNVLKAKINKEITTYEEEVVFAKSLLQNR